jgi:glutathione S-transferase
MSLTFYFAPMSTASTVHWSLEELGIPYEAVKVDLSDAADKQKKLGPLNPNLKVPVLVHDGTVIFESVAIQIYLGETFGVEKGLFPAPGPKRGEALKWLVWANVTLGEAVGRWQRNTSDRFPAALQNAEAGAAARKDLDQLIGIFEKELGSKSYLLGKDICLSDIHLASFFQWLGFCGVDLAPFPKTKAWFERCSARPSLAKSMAAG